MIISNKGWYYRNAGIYILGFAYSDGETEYGFREYNNGPFKTFADMKRHAISKSVGDRNRAISALKSTRKWKKQTISNGYVPLKWHNCTDLRDQRKLAKKKSKGNK